jgi:hypothetical protein
MLNCEKTINLALTVVFKKNVDASGLSSRRELVRSKRFNILGQIAHPGSYVLTNSTTILDAVALGGGFRGFCQTKAYIRTSTEF